MLASLIGRTMEVYINNMLVKLLQASDHIFHLKEFFELHWQYNMRLNPTKCSFGITFGKFLSYLMTQQGIEANPEQIWAILNMPSPKNKRDVQKLVGRVAVLN